MRRKTHASGWGAAATLIWCEKRPMMLLDADSVSVFQRILDTATDNLRVAKILVQLGLDPDNVTWHEIFNRLFDIFLHNITLANLFALIGAIFLVATLLTRTMVPLRIAN